MFPLLWLLSLPSWAGPDHDDDGYDEEDECDDEDPDVHPGAEEICNGIDDDCDEVIDPGCPTGTGDTAEPPTDGTDTAPPDTQTGGGPPDTGRPEDTDDIGGTDDTGEPFEPTGGTDETSAEDDAEEIVALNSDRPPAEEGVIVATSIGCACDSSSPGALGWGAALAVLGLRRRRQPLDSGQPLAPLKRIE